MLTEKELDEIEKEFDTRQRGRVEKNMIVNSFVYVRFLGESDPISLLHDKVYRARVLKKDWFGIVDESGEEYAYPPHLFEIVTEELNRK